MTFSNKILSWYNENKRDLPWRESKNPYFVWLSEVILQQTRVAQGTAYYHKFVEHFPTVGELASASEEEILNLWQGLGYYSRARNLHKAAQQVVNEFNGEFPITYKDILSLKGVGDYTASAISSICFGERKAVVDGNVYRVLARYFGVDTPIDSTQGKKQFKSLAEELLPAKESGEYNQGLMELGALVCSPKSPDCFSCPIMASCIAHSKNTTANYPVKSKKTKQRKRFFNYLVIENNGSYYMEKRTEKDIWKNMYQFPLIETSKEQETPVFESSDLILLGKKEAKKHVLSHQTIYAVFWEYKQIKESELNHNWIKIDDFSQKPLPRLIELYVEEFLTR